MFRLESRSGQNEEKLICSTNSRKDLLSVCFVSGTGAELDGKDIKVNIYITFCGILRGRQHVKITWTKCCGNTKKTPGRGEDFRGMIRNPVPFLNRTAACSVCSWLPWIEMTPHAKLSQSLTPSTNWPFRIHQSKKAELCKLYVTF